MQDAPAVEERIPAVQAFIDAMGYEAGQFMVDFMSAEVRRWRGDCEGAIPLYESVLAASPASQQEVQTRAMLARCLLRTGDAERARTVIDRALELVPAHAGGLVVLAEIQQAAGVADEARATLTGVFGILENADPEYLVGREARALRAELGG